MFEVSHVIMAKVAVVTPGDGFARFVLKDVANRRYVLLALTGIVVQCTLFKYLYPFADFGPDAFAYITWAATHVNFAFSPVGYSKFLYLFHQLTHSDTALVAFHYFLVNASLLLFFFSLLYWYNPIALVRNILFVFFFFNPLFLYISNNIMSDSLFIALSLFWFTQLMWIIHRPRTWQVWVHGILLALIFTIRYYALYYPLIAFIAFLFSQYTLRRKIIGVLFPCVLIGMFILYTREEAYKATGMRLFSAFSGWQVCNNVLYMYPNITVDSMQLPPETRALHREVIHYFDTRPVFLQEVSPRFKIFSFYMWAQRSPMRIYLNNHLKQTGHTEFQGMVALSPLYNTYGTYLVKEHPVAYVQYYLWPNTINYLLPPLEKLEIYNYRGRDEVYDPIIKEWFDYKSMKVYTRAGSLQQHLLYCFPALFTLANFMLLLGLVRGGIMKTYKTLDKPFLYVLLLVTCLFLVNMVFSIVSAVVVFRYQVFQLLVFFSFGLMLTGPWVKEKVEGYLEEEK